MPRTNIPVTNITKVGVAWPATDGATGDNINGNVVQNGPNLCLLVRNPTGAPIMLTFVTPNTAGGYGIDDDVKTIAASAQQAFGPFPVDLFGDLLQIGVSATGLKIIAFQAVKS